jgi:hypothetical protein
LNVLRLTVDNPDELLNASAYSAGALLRVEYSTDGGSNFSALTTTAIVTLTTAYTLYHQAGDSTTLYRSRYSNSGATIFSEYSATFSATTAPVEYATLPLVKLRLNIPDNDTASDGIIQTIVEEVNAWLEGEIGFTVGPVASATRTFDGRLVRIINGLSDLPVYPWGVRAVSAVSTTDGTGGITTVQTASDVVIRPHDHEREPGWPGFDLVVKDGATWMWPMSGLDVISITATWGWAVVPTELKSIGTRVAIAAFRARGAGSGRTFAIGEDISGVAAEQLSAADWAVIAKYSTLKLAKSDVY